uniref:Uncharacterized protein n=1 Tax=Trichogramma kaykai TaxID=54128 RepID=A0ABD2WL70_9HYME
MKICTKVLSSRSFRRCLWVSSPFVSEVVKRVPEIQCWSCRKEKVYIIEFLVARAAGADIQGVHNIRIGRGALGGATGRWSRSSSASCVVRVKTSTL